jgi:ABC-2 type transport system permease protein
MGGELLFGDTTVLLGRSLRHITRSVDAIITTAKHADRPRVAVRLRLRRAIDTGSEAYVN